MPELLLAVAGGGPLRGELERQIEEFGLVRHVRLLGRVSDADLPLLYRAADLSVVPSTALEGFGLICVESLASGTPAMVTPVGGLPEVVGGLDPSLVLEEAGPGAIAEGIVTALRGSRPLPAAADCVTYVKERYAWPVIDMRIRYIKPVRFGQRVMVKATLREWENRLLIDYLVSDRESGQRLTKGTTVQVAVDMSNGEMCFVSPPVLFERLGLQRA